MKILIACEFSGIVRDAFIKKGHNAISCDLLPTERPGPHVIADVMFIILEKWDMVIAHPPCTYLTTTANRSFKNNPDRWQKRLDAMLFVYKLMNVDIEKICIENPVGVISTHIRKPEQYIQPYDFGHPESKKTGLWLKGLPLLKPTNIVRPEHVVYNSKRNKSGKSTYPLKWGKGSHSGKSRGLTFQGIADAMADQWG